LLAARCPRRRGGILWPVSRQLWQGGRGPFRADQVRAGDPYELSQGHPVVCAPTGQDGAGPNGLGFAVLDSDPAVKRAGVDAGIQLTPDTLRAPDVAVNFTPGDGTWATAAPLVVEYAGQGQDEADLRDKIAEFHAAGTAYVWVARVADRCVEVHERGKAPARVDADGTLTAPGVLALPVPVRALFDRDAAHETTLRNILSARGYASLDALRNAEALAARRAVLVMQLEAAFPLTEGDRARIARCDDVATLDRWLLRTRAAASAADVLAD